VVLSLSGGNSAADWKVGVYNSLCTANPNESFYSLDGGATWYDLNGVDNTSNFSIKAFGAAPDETPPPARVPEPASAMMLGLAALTASRRRRRRS